MGQHRKTAEDTHENLSEPLDWQIAECNDQAVAQALHSGQGVDTVYGLDDVGLLDGFFAFLDETGIKAHWQSLAIDGVRHLFVPAILFGCSVGIAGSTRWPTGWRGPSTRPASFVLGGPAR